MVHNNSKKRNSLCTKNHLQNNNYISLQKLFMTSACSNVREEHLTNARNHDIRTKYVSQFKPEEY